MNNNIIQRRVAFSILVFPLIVLAITTQYGLSGQESAENNRIKAYPVEAVSADQLLPAAKQIQQSVSPQLADDLELSLWGVDSLVADPIAIDIDDLGRLYYTRTRRQKNSEFDIRQHQEWEVDSIALQTVDDKRQFYHRVLAPERSADNAWLADLNRDGSSDWRDLTVETEQVYQLRDSDRDGLADQKQLLVDDFSSEISDTAGALLSFDGDLFVGVGPDLWRFRDSDGDGVLDHKIKIATGFGVHVGFSGHGMSGLEMGPDGRLYWAIGDIGFHGGGTDGKIWQYPNQGVIVRCDPDGSDFEVFAAGLRNTHEFAFDQYGNLIAADNDGDHPGESERLVYVTEGSDSGWRINWQFGKYNDPDNNAYKVWIDEGMHTPRHDQQAAYFTPPLANFVNGPTGMLYNPGTALGPQWRDRFFLVEFVGNPAQSGVHAFRLTPQGAGFKLAQRQQIVTGILATGMDFGPDGALYIGDWVNGWRTKDQGRVWKLTASSGEKWSDRQQTQKILGQDFNQKASPELAQLLAHPDQRVRQKAQFALVRHGADGNASLQQTLTHSHSQLARIHAVWGINQLARKKSEHAQYLLSMLADGDAEIRAQVAKALGDIRYRDAAAALLPLLQDPSSRVRFFAAEALGRIAYQPAVSHLIAMLEDNDDQDVYLRHAGTLALARIGEPKPIADLARSRSRALRIAAVVALRRMASTQVTAFLNDRDQYIVTEAARAINDDYSIVAALPELAALLNTTSFTGEALVRRAISANLRVGDIDNLQNLATYADNKAAPLELRIEAINALATWLRPSVLDRVDGRYRGVVERAPLTADDRTVFTLTRLMNDKHGAIRHSAATAIGKLGLVAAIPDLVTALQHDSDHQVRIAALASLAQLQYPQLDTAIATGLSDSNQAVRIEALERLGVTPLQDAKKATYLASVINGSDTSVEEKQSALLMLGRLQLAHTQTELELLLTKLRRGELSNELLLELGEAITATQSQELVQQWQRIKASFPQTGLLSEYSDALYGGKPERAYQIVFRDQSAQCIRCHAYNDFGGSAGPQLVGIANNLSREQILEALIDPSARIAPGFGVVSLELIDGTTVAGVLQSESEDKIILQTSDNHRQTIAKARIARQINAPSSMPSMVTLLSKKQIRDVVAYLATLKD